MKGARSIWFKSLAVFLVIVIVIGIFPMSVFATEYQNHKTLTTVDTETDADLIIKEEVVEERTANSKTYLLEDGTYCDLIFSNPIHKKDNGEWEDQSDTESYITEGESISRVASQLSSTTTDDGLVMLDPKVNLSLIGITEKTLTLEEEENNVPDYTISEDWATLTDKSFGIVSFNISSDKNYEKSEATINANLIMDYYSDNKNNNISISPFTLDLSNKTLKFENFENEYLYNPIVDFNGVTGEGQAIWNITSEYIKIENGISNINSMLIGQNLGSDITISNAYMQRHYRVIDDNDIGFTYHTVNMGRAGMVYINDYTNTVNVEREELGLPGGILPVSISTFINGHMDYATYGVGGRINYDSKLEYFANTFVWNMFNGSSVRFQRTNNIETNEEGLEKWVECSYNPQGYTLWVDTDASRDFIYSNNYIVDESGNKYTFNGDGYVISVISGNNANDKLTINYSNRRISSITDGVGREFIFTYDSYENMRGLNKISINTHNSSSNDIQILYDYKKINNKLYLTKATYADDKTVEYSYDSIGRLLSVKNIDGSILEFNYAISEDLAKQNKNPVYYGRINSYTKKVLDNTNNYVTEYTTTIKASHSYRRVFSQKHEEFTDKNQTIKSNNGVNPFEETIQFNRNLDVLYFTDNSGNNMYADYDDNHKLLSLVTPIDTQNLVKNGEMKPAKEGACVPAIWDRKNISNRPNANESVMIYDSVADNHYVKIMNTNGVTRTLYQDISNINGKKGDKFAVSATGTGSATIPQEYRFWGVKISAKNENGKFEIIHTMSLDASLWDEQQIRSTAFSLPFDTNTIRIELIAQDQNGSVTFDDISLYKTESAYVAAVDDVEEEKVCKCEGCEYPFCTCKCASKDECNCVSCNIKTSYTNDSHGNPLETKTTNGLTNILSKNEYTPDGNYLSKYIDENNVATSYEYSLTNGLLLSEKLANDSTVSYGYDAIGMLKSVSQDVTNVLTGDAVTMNTEYSYENDKIKSISHNGFSYTYDYDIYGNVQSINVGETQLVSYEYNNDYFGNISKITYANGDEIIYSYDNKDNIIGIKFNDDSDWRYTYTYDEYNQLKSFTDNVSKRVTTYNKTIDGIKYVEVVETLGENSKVIYGITEENKGQYTQSVFGKDYSIKTETQYDSTTGNTVTNKTAGTVVFGADGQIENICTKDAFERIVSDYMTMHANTETETVPFGVSLNLKNEYTYKNASDNQTTRLVDTFTSTVYWESENETEILRSVSLKYDYDEAGRITMISVPENPNNPTAYTPVNIYKYDEAGQLVMEANATLNTVCSYTYDAGGNITSKNYHDNAQFNDKTNTFELGEPTQTIKYEYDSVWKDKLISYNGTQIDYDAFGNPLKYTATSFNDQAINMDLEWNGRLLTSATAVDGSERYEYSYDAAGLRTEKTVFKGQTVSKEVIDESGNKTTVDEHIFLPQTKFEYIWSNDMPAGYKITLYESSTDENGNQTAQTIEKSSFIVNVMYNENGEALGVNCHSESEGEKSSLTFLFVKDAQGNIVSISACEGEYFFDFVYDAFGNVKMDITGEAIDKIQETINSMDSEIEKLLYSLASGLGLAIVTGITFACVPNAYRGYIYDMETGLYYCQSRYYSPEWGRFINADDTSLLELTTGNIHGANLFAYCNNDPVDYIDKNGYLRKHWYNKVSNVAKAIDVAIIGLTAGKSIIGIKAIRAFLKANKRKLVKNITKQLTKMIGSYSVAYLSAAFEAALTLFGTSIGDLIARGLDWVDPLWKKGYRRNNGYILN